jgi:hypothetical protein
MFVVFLAFSVKTGGGEINWPVTAYLSGLVLTAYWLTHQLQSPVAWYRRMTYATLTLTCAVGLTLTVFMHRTEYLYPLLAQLTGEPTSRNALPLRKVDPSCRLRGWHYLGEEVDRLREQVRVQEGVEPNLAGGLWNLPGELGFYCQGHPQAYSIGLALGDRHSQYDLWHNPLDDAGSFTGRTFIVVGGNGRVLAKAFDRVEVANRFQFRVGPYPVAEWFVHVCHGFKGFPPPPSQPAH